VFGQRITASRRLSLGIAAFWTACYEDSKNPHSHTSASKHPVLSQTHTHNLPMEMSLAEGVAARPCIMLAVVAIVDGVSLAAVKNAAYA